MHLNYVLYYGKTKKNQTFEHQNIAQTSIVEDDKTKRLDKRLYKKTRQ